MTIKEQIIDILHRQNFLNNEATLLKKIIEVQGYITDDQYANCEMYAAMANENEAELLSLCDIADGKVPIARCRHCKQSVVREAGIWLHSDKNDFFKCGKAGVPDEEYLAKWMPKGVDNENQ